MLGCALQGLRKCKSCGSVRVAQELVRVLVRAVAARIRAVVAGVLRLRRNHFE